VYANYRRRRPLLLQTLSRLPIICSSPQSIFSLKLRSLIAKLRRVRGRQQAYNKRYNRKILAALPTLHPRPQVPLGSNSLASGEARQDRPAAYNFDSQISPTTDRGAHRSRDHILLQTATPLVSQPHPRALICTRVLLLRLWPLHACCLYASGFKWQSRPFHRGNLLKAGASIATPSSSLSQGSTAPPQHDALLPLELLRAYRML
jgi:hypothetical protein